MNKMLMNALPGKYRTALCTGCNLNRKNQLFIPLYCHNFRGFDSHLILHSLDLLLDKARFSSLSRNSEQIITMSIGMWKFIDTMSFMPSSLEKLADLLKNNDREKLVHTKRLAGENMDLLCGKGVYPYEYLDSISKLQERSIPKKEAFYSVLSGRGISDAAYLKAKLIWSAFQCTTLSDYTRLYCRSDTHLLADVWTNFTKAPYSYFNIHPEAGYVTLPSYAFDCFKYHIHRTHGTLLSLMDETMPMMYSDIVRGIRGGSCMLLKKGSFDSKMTSELLQMATPAEAEEYNNLMKDLRAQAQKESHGKSVMAGDRICSADDCQEYARANIATCVRHAEKTLIAFDFNNLTQSCKMSYPHIGQNTERISFLTYKVKES